MPARNTAAHVHAAHDAPADKAVKLDPTAANDAAPAQPATLDALIERLGAPSAAMRAVAFQGYDASAGLDAGRATATERILSSVPAFAGSALSIWASLSAEGRKRVVGFTPGFVAVLVHEAAVLRDLNARYDDAAKRAAVHKARCEAKAAATLGEGRACRDDALRAVRRFVPPAQQEADALRVAADGAETAAAVALSCEALADWMGAWLVALPADARDALAAMGVDEAMGATLRGRAAAMRAAQEAVDGLADENRVTQVQLDAQDGRVLHVVDVIHGAFRAAARRDRGVRVPELGALRSRFGRPHRRAKAPAVAPPKDPPPT